MRVLHMYNHPCLPFWNKRHNPKRHFTLFLIANVGRRRLFFCQLCVMNDAVQKRPSQLFTCPSAAYDPSKIQKHIQYQ